MSHKISKQEAREKHAWYEHCQELNNAGLQVSKMSRWRKKQLARESKVNRFIDMLKRRGGYAPEKKDKKKEEGREVV